MSAQRRNLKPKMKKNTPALWSSKSEAHYLRCSAHNLCCSPSKFPTILNRHRKRHHSMDYSGQLALAASLVASPLAFLVARHTDRSLGLVVARPWLLVVTHRHPNDPAKFIVQTRNDQNHKAPASKRHAMPQFTPLRLS